VWSFTSTESNRFAVDRSTVSSADVKNVWSCTSTASIRYAVDRSTLSGAEFKNEWSCNSTASTGLREADGIIRLLPSE